MNTRWTVNIQPPFGMCIHFPFEAKDDIKKIPGRKWHGRARFWHVGISPTNALKLAAIAESHGAEISGSGEFLDLLARAGEEEAEAKRTKTSDDLPAVPNTKTDAWAHQRQAYWFAHPRDSTMLAMDMGTGKSKVVVDLIVNRGHTKTLIVCPKSVFIEWPKQFLAHAGSDVAVCVPPGNVKRRTELAKEHLEINSDGQSAIVINYEAVWREPFATFAREEGFDLLVLDEIHRTKSPSGVGSKYLAKLAADVPFKLGLTGTPMPHSPLDAFAQYRILDGTIFGDNWNAFRRQFAVYGGYEDKQVVGYKNQDLLNELFYSAAYRITKDVLDLPEESDMTRECSLAGEALDRYEELSAEYEAARRSGELIENPGMILTNLLRLQETAGGFSRETTSHWDFLSGSDKMDALVDIATDIGPHEPLVVFFRFRPEIAMARSVLDNRRVGELTGSKNDLAAFQAGDLDTLLVQIQAGGVGIDLTMARYAVYYSLGFSLGDYLQSRARLHRPGQAKHTFYYHLVSKGTVDEKVYAALSKRENVVNAILKEVV